MAYAAFFLFLIGQTAIVAEAYSQRASVYGATADSNDGAIHAALSNYILNPSLEVEWSSGRGIGPDGYPPGLHIITATIAFLTGRSVVEVLAIEVPVLIFLLLPLTLFLFSRKFFNDDFKAAAATMLFELGTLIQYQEGTAYGVYAVFAGLSLTALFFVCLMNFFERNDRRFAVRGMALFLIASVTHSEAFPIMTFGAIAYWLASDKRPKLSRNEWAACITAFAVVAALQISWAATVYNFTDGANPPALTTLLQKVQRFASDLLEIMPNVIGLPFVALAGLGLLQTGSRKTTPATALLAAPLAFALAVDVYMSRGNLQIAFFSSVLAVEGISLVAGTVAKKIRFKNPIPTSCLAILFLFSATTPWYASSFQRTAIWHSLEISPHYWYSGPQKMLFENKKTLENRGITALYVQNESAYRLHLCHYVGEILAKSCRYYCSPQNASEKCPRLKDVPPNSAIISEETLGLPQISNASQACPKCVNPPEIRLYYWAGEKR